MTKEKGERIMTSKNLKVLMIEPNREPYVKVIKDELSDLQKQVGGHIDVICLREGTTNKEIAIDLVINDEGKLISLPFNRWLFSVGLNDFIVGDAFLVASNADGDFVSLPEEEIRKWSYEFRL